MQMTTRSSHAGGAGTSGNPWRRRVMELFELRRAVVVMAALAVCALPAVAGFQDTATPGQPGSAQALVIEVGHSVMLRFDGMRRVAIVHKQIADVTVASTDELLVMADPEGLGKTGHTMLYVWDREGLHKFAVTTVGLNPAEQVARELRDSLGPGLSAQPVSRSMVVVEGEVADEQAHENLTALLDAASTDEVQVVSMVATSGEAASEAARAAEALREIVDPAVQVRSWGDEVVAVEGELGSQAEVEKARSAVTALTEGLRVVDMITVRGQDLAEQAPVNQIQRLLGDEFTVTALRGNMVAVDGVVQTQAELERVTRLLEAYSNQIQTVNMVQFIPPKPDLDTAQQALSGALDEGIEVTRVGDEALMLEGSVASEEELSGIERVLQMFHDRVPIVNLVSVVEPAGRRVQVGVKVLEINRGATDDLGVDWGQWQGADAGATYRQQPFLFGDVDGVGWEELYNFSAQVHALIDQQKARLLAEPNLLVNENEEANILIGGEIPVPIAQTAVGGGSAITVEWKPFGVNLTIRPTIGPDGERVKLEVKPEVSSLDFGNAVTVSGITIPALRSRRAETIVTVSDGGVLAIGGLLSSEQSRSVSKIPILGDLPIIGQLFRHDTFINDRSELIILVLPQILGEDGEPVHPIPVPEGLEGTDAMRFGRTLETEMELEE